MRTNWNDTLRKRRAQPEPAPELTTEELRDACTAAGINWVGKKRETLEQLLAAHHEVI